MFVLGGPHRSMQQAEEYKKPGVSVCSPARGVWCHQLQALSSPQTLLLQKAHEAVRVM